MTKIDKIPNKLPFGFGVSGFDIRILDLFRW